MKVSRVLVLAASLSGLAVCTPAWAQSATATAPPLPPITEEDRRAAFPELRGHATHDRAFNAFVLFDQLEWQSPSSARRLSWDTKGWFGTDTNRFWFRSEGERESGSGIGEAHAFYGRAVARWWDLVAGIRQDVGGGPARTWAALGIQGLSPYWFDVEATAYVGAGGRTHVRFEAEYDLLVTNRLILQPLFETEIYGRSDPERHVGAGLSTIEGGLRLRFEIRRELGPYLGVVWNQKFLGTADMARSRGDHTGQTKVIVGLRTWF